MGDGFLCQEMMLFCVYVSLTALCRALGFWMPVTSMVAGLRPWLPLVRAVARPHSSIVWINTASLRTAGNSPRLDVGYKIFLRSLLASMSIRRRIDR